MKYAIKQNKKTSKKLIILSVVLILILMGAGVFWWSKAREKEPTFISLNPPTKQEQAAGDDKKKEMAAEDQKNTSQAAQTSAGADGSPSTPTKVSAEVIITSAAQFDQAQTPGDTSDDIIDIRAYMPDRYEEGTCTYTLTKGALRVVETSPARPDMNYTICTNPEIERSALAETGDWKVVVSYDSTAAHGEATQTIRGVK